MREIIVVTIFILSHVFIKGDDRYIPKNIKEREVLERVRGQQLKLGIKGNYFGDEKIDGESLNDIVEDMLKNYLQLDLKVEKGSWHEIYTKFKEKEIDLINFLTHTEERKEFALFTDKILEENLTLVSKEMPIGNLEFLNGMTVYVSKDTIYERFLKRFIEKNNLELKYEVVSNINLKEKTLFADSNLNVLYEKNRLNIGKLPDASIGILKEHRELLDILNSALDEKYSEKIEEWFRKRRESIYKYKIDKLLTESEKEYLKTLKPLTVAYQNLDNISGFSQIENKYIGIVPSTFDYLSDKLEIQIAEKNKLKKSEWNEIYEEFKNKKIDFIPISETKERNNSYIFTNKIFDLKIYEVDSLKNKAKNKVGVLKESVVEYIAKEHYASEKIVSYVNKEKMYQDLKKGDLNKVLTTDLSKYDKLVYNIKILEEVPINIAMHKDKEILRNIMNKILAEVIDFNEIVEGSNLSKNKKELIERERNRTLISLAASVCIVLMILEFYQSLKVLSHKKKNKELLKDELTGLYSRRLYNEFCKTENLTGYALLLDLNNFKKLNDTYGHDYGDMVLIETGKYLKEVFKDDYIFRISGDEFYIFSFYIIDVKSKIKELEHLFRTSKLMKRYEISFSLGYYKKRERESVEYAFKYADLAMYSAKKNKRAWSEEATKEFVKNNRRKKLIENMIKISIDTEFYAVFQGKYELETGKMIGAEALTRWENKFLGVILPKEFIPVAENLSLLYKIDYKIAEEAIKKTRELLDKKEVEDDFRMSFNMSMETFEREDLVSYISNLLKNYSLDGKNLEIEMTESLALDGGNNVIEKLNKIRGMGIYLSIDNFTVDYSTISQLITLPIDVIKFDKSLISGVNDNIEFARDIYAGLTNMIKSLKLKVIAEGIEKKEQSEFLKEIGISYGQGYYFGRPQKELKKV